MPLPRINLAGTRLKAISRKSAYVLGGQFLGLVLGFAGTFILSHLVAKADFASYALFVSLASAGTITHGGLINFATRFWNRNQQDGANFWRFVTRRFWSFAPLLIGITIFGTCFLDSTTSTLLLYPLVLGSAVGFTRFSLQAAVLNSAEDFRRFFFLNAIGTLLKFAAPIGLAVCANGSFASLALGFAIYATAMFAICEFCFHPAPSTSDDASLPPGSPKWSRDLSAYGKPFFWIGVGGWGLQFADRWVVAAFFDAEKVADFAYASQIVAFLPSLIAAWLLQVAYPGFFRHADTHRERSDWRRLALRADALTAVFIGLTLVGTLAAHVLFSVLLGNLISETYRNSLPLIIPASMVATALQVNQFHYLLLQANLDSAAIMRIAIWVSALKILLSVFAALVSWDALQWAWLTAPVIVGLLGRLLVRQAVFSLRSPGLSSP